MTLHVLGCLLLAGFIPAWADSNRIPLEGTWRFGFERARLSGSLTVFLPGSLDQAGYGNKTSGPGKGWLSRPYEYDGPAWYEREVVVPDAWRGKRVELFLERAHWETEVWLDGKPYGRRNSLSVPHVYDLGVSLTPGRHTITLCVDNSYKIDVGRNAHSVTEHTQTNWNGIIGRMELRATDPVWIDRVWLEPALESKTVRVMVTVGNATGAPVKARIKAGDVSRDVTVEAASTGAELVIPANGNILWDEYEGRLQTVTLRLESGRFRDEWEGKFGLRQIGTKGTQFLLNGHPLFIRGTLECSIFPLTGYPPTRTEEWARLYRIARSYGLNHFRFHSWCPPEAAFVAADEAGFTLQVELPVWNATVGKDDKLVEFMREEGKRIQQAYGNHPSFTMLALGNELRGDFGLMDELVNELKSRDQRRLYTFSSDHVRRKPGPTSDYFVTHHTEQGPVRIHGARFTNSNEGTDFDLKEHVARINVPLIAHELGQWVTHPDYAEIGKYTGVLKPRNLEVYRAGLEARGLLDQAKQFQQASGRFAWLLYKEDIEAGFRTPNYGGMQLLQLQDFPGQGEALIGVLDSFWESKGILTPSEMQGFMGQTVPLARFSKHVWKNNETFAARLVVAHYGKKKLEDAAMRWRLMHGTEKLASGTTASKPIPAGQVVDVGEVRTALSKLTQAAHLRLEVEFAGIRNNWEIWVYPERLEVKPAEILVTATWDDAARRKLAEGGKVLLTLPAGKSGAGAIPIRFLPVFWSLTWFPKQPGTMGILCDPEHAALRGFPTDFHSNYQWWELTEGASAFVLDDAPAALRPLVQVIDDYHRNHKLGAVIEAKVGNGMLLASSLDLMTKPEERMVARQLLASLLQYMRSPQFQPTVELGEKAVDQLALRPLMTRQ